MLTRWGDFDRSFQTMDEFRKRMDRLFQEFDGHAAASTGGWPRASLFDQGANLAVFAEVPGISEAGLRLTLNQDLLTIEGERRVEAPQGYSVHRQERGGLRFARTVRLPCKVDAERVAATVTDGVLTVTLPKAPEARPRQIAVRAQS